MCSRYVEEQQHAERQRSQLIIMVVSISFGVAACVLLLLAVRKLRKHIFKLEDETTRLATANAAQAQESAQVGKLLHETIRRNAELVDAVATLQNQVDKLRKSALAGKVAAAGRARKKAAKKNAAKGPPPVSVAADPLKGGRAFADKRALARAGYSSEDSQGSLWEAGLQAEPDLSDGGLEDIMPGGAVLL